MSEQLTIAEVAGRIGVTAKTVANYRHSGLLPTPDGYLGRTPWWTAETIDAWQAARPGRDWRSKLRKADE